MLEDPLDEPEFYCVDVAGFGANLNLNGPLQAHICKPVAGGEGQPAGGRSHLRRDLLLAPCADVAPSLSRWVFPGLSPNR